MDHVQPMLAQIICDSTREKGIIARFAMARVSKFVANNVFNNVVLNSTMNATMNSTNNDKK